MILPVRAVPGRLSRRLVALSVLMIIEVLSPAPLIAAQSGRSGSEVLPDLAAMTPLPGDVSAHEVVLGPGTMLSGGEIVEHARALGANAGPTERTLADAVWQRGYANSL